jgi:large subunit ribosomal protein L11
VERGSDDPKKNKIGKVSKDKIYEIARTKMKDLNTTDIDKAARIVEGTARSMGVEVG